MQVLTLPEKAYRASEEKPTSEFLASKDAHVIPSSGILIRAAEEYRTIYDPVLNKAYKVAGECKRLSPFKINIQQPLIGWSSSRKLSKARRPQR